MGKSSISKTMFWSFMEQGFSKLIAMIVQIVFARLLFPETFGVMAILLVVVSVAEAMAQSGLGLALIQDQEANDESYSTCFWLSLLLAILLYLGIYFSAPLISDFYDMPELVNYLRVLGLTVILNSGNSIQRSFLQKSMDFKSIFEVGLFSVLLAAVIGLSFAFAGFGVWALVAQSLALSIFTFMSMLVVVPWKPTFAFNGRAALGLLKYGWKICFTSILSVLYSGISELIIGRVCSTSDLGYYSQGRKYPQATIGVMSNAIANVLFPAFSALKDNPVILKANLKKALMLGSFVIAPVSFLCAVLGEPLVALLLTEKWLPCVVIFQLICISNSWLIVQLVNLRAYMALGDSSLYMKLQIIKVLIGGLLIFGTAVYTRDIYATAVATLCSSLIGVFFVDMHSAKRKFGYGRVEQLLDLLPCFSLSAIAALASCVISFLDLSYIETLVSQLFVFVFIYMLGAKLIRRKEIGIYKELFLNLFRK